MAKFSKISKLSQSQKEELLIDFCEALTALKNSTEAAQFLKDLLGPQEIEMLAKRLAVAKRLIEGKTYGEIQTELKVSQGTIGRVNLWLQMSGAGYRLVAQRTKKKPEKYSQFAENMKAFKRRYARYYWPELLFEEVMKRAERRQREKLLSTLEGIEDKGKILKEFNQYLLEVYGVPGKKKAA